MRCPNCQAPITESDLFCGECGRPASLDVLSPSSSQPAAEPPPMPGPPVQQPPAPQPPAHQAPAPAPAPSSYAPTPAAPPPPAQSSYAPPPPPEYAEQPKKKSNTGCIIAVVAVLVLGCCGILGFSFASGLVEDLFSDPFGPSTPDYFDPPVAPPTTCEGQTEIWVQNNLNEAICHLYISPANSYDWGEDWLANYGSIPAGTYATFAITSGQTVDMTVEDCSGNELDVQYDVYIYPEGITYTLDPLQ